MVVVVVAVVLLLVVGVGVGVGVEVVVVCLYRSQRESRQCDRSDGQRWRRWLFLDSSHDFMRTRASRCPLVGIW